LEERLMLYNCWRMRVISWDFVAVKRSSLQMMSIRQKIRDLLGFLRKNNENSPPKFLATPVMSIKNWISGASQLRGVFRNFGGEASYFPLWIFKFRMEKNSKKMEQNPSKEKNRHKPSSIPRLNIPLTF